MIVVRGISEDAENIKTMAIIKQKYIKELELENKRIKNELATLKDEKEALDNYVANGANFSRTLLLLQSITHINRVLVQSPSSSYDLLSEIMLRAQHVLKCDASSVLLLNETRDKLYFEVAHGEKGAEIKRLYLDLNKGIGGLVARSGEAFLENDPYSNEHFDSSFDRETGFVTKSILCVPMFDGTEVCGVIQAINSQHPDGFSAEDVSVFEIFAQQAVVAILKQRSIDAIEERNRLLEDANKMKSAFLASVSHELRTPLTPIIGWAQILGEGGADEAMFKEGITEIHKQSNYLNNLISDLVHLMQIDTEQVHLDISQFDIIPLFNEALSSFMEPLMEKNIQYSTTENPVPKVRADRDKLKRCLEHIIENAIKYNEEDGILKVSFDQTQTHVIVETTNSGHISDTVIQSMLSSNDNIKGASALEYEGLGIGTALLKGFVKLFDGHLLITSSKSENTITVRLELPIPEEGVDAEEEMSDEDFAALMASLG
jgi:signal transduction histidine kinase